MELGPALKVTLTDIEERVIGIIGEQGAMDLV